MRKYNQEFLGNCCEDHFESCSWTCEEIMERISSRAPKGMVYSRGELDSKLSTLRSLIAIAAASNSVLIGRFEDRPLANVNNAGYIYTVPNDAGTEILEAYLSSGNAWLELLNRSIFTAQSTYTGDMEKGVYCQDDPEFIDVARGGTGKDMSSFDGMVSLDGGVFSAINHLKVIDSRNISTDILLTTEDKHMQLFNPSSANLSIILPVSPDNNYFRLTNISEVFDLKVKLVAGVNVLDTLNPLQSIDLVHSSSINRWIRFAKGAVSI